MKKLLLALLLVFGLVALCSCANSTGLKDELSDNEWKTGSSVTEETPIAEGGITFYDDGTGEYEGGIPFTYEIVDEDSFKIKTKDALATYRIEERSGAGFAGTMVTEYEDTELLGGPYESRFILSKR